MSWKHWMGIAAVILALGVHSYLENSSRCSRSDGPNIEIRK
jgi:hypothetical protein